MRRLLIVLLLLGIAILSGAEFRISRELEKDPLVFIQDNQRDANGEYCARVQINSDIKGLEFDSARKPIDIVRETGKSYVFLSPGEKSLILRHADYAELEYVFPLTLTANTAYVMTIVKGGYENADAGLVTVTFELNESGIYIGRDDVPPVLKHQRATEFRLKPGTYTFKFSKAGYTDVIKEIEVKEDMVENITLQPGESRQQMQLPGVVIISSLPDAAEIYIDDQKMGFTSSQIDLVAGEHKLTLKDKLHYTTEQLFTIKEGQTLELPVIELKPRFGYIQVHCDQQDAQLYLDGTLLGTGNITRQKLVSGNHLLSAKMDFYHDQTEDFLVNDGEEKSFDIKLKPAFGILEIRTSPVEGAEVYINDEYAGQTPYRDVRLPSGIYQVRVEMALYRGTEESVTVKDEQLTQKRLMLTKDFGTLKVLAPDCAIYVNGTIVGRDNYRADLKAGNYNIEAQRKSYISESRYIYLQAGAEEEITLVPEPIMGSLTIITEPAAAKNAEIWINGVRDKAVTPAVIPLLIGDYNIKVKHPQFLEKNKPVTIKEGVQEKLVFELETYKGSMLAARNSWRRQAAIGGIASLLTIGAGIYFNAQGDAYFDDYLSSTSTQSVQDNWDDMESSYNKRDLCFTISILPVTYTAYCWIRSLSFGSK
ncbi:MAG: PEGA domain-containing protein [Candidatus Cloacimonetes bacterium]|nr:PEGA domain-containing protein [Candidatus Cloacimonadota bacterium]